MAPQLSVIVNPNPPAQVRWVPLSPTREQLMAEIFADEWPHGDGDLPPAATARGIA